MFVVAHKWTSGAGRRARDADFCSIVRRPRRYFHTRQTPRPKHNLGVNTLQKCDEGDVIGPRANPPARPLTQKSLVDNGGDRGTGVGVLGGSMSREWM